MRGLALILVLLLAAPSDVFSQYDHALAAGDWLSFELDEQGDVGLYYLRIEENYQGAFGYKFYGSESRVVRFSSEQVQLADGMLIISPSVPESQANFEIRIVVTAYDLPMMTGIMYFYQNFGEGSVPFNSFFLRMGQRADPNEPHENPIVEAVRERLSEI